MCLSCELHDKWPPFIEFLIWFILQGINVGNHFAVWVVMQSHVIDVTHPVFKNTTHPNATLNMNNTLNLLNSTNITTSLFNNNLSTTFTPTTLPAMFPLNTTEAVPVAVAAVKKITPTKWINGTLHILHMSSEEQWEDLLDFRRVFLVFVFVGVVLFAVHTLMLLPNVIQSFRDHDPASLKDTGGSYFQNLLKMHSIMLIFETIAYDIPIGCLVMEVLALIWEGPLTADDDLRSSEVILGLSLSGLAFIAMYKGMMPLFLWIGNPFCFPCIPLRLFIVFPGGLIAVVMTFTPVMGVAKARLLQFAPEVIQNEIEGMAQTFFSIGMIFWILFIIAMLIGSCCWYKVCREGADGDVCSLLF